VYDSFMRVLLQPSASFTVERRELRVQRISTSVKRKQVGISNNASMKFSSANPPMSRSPPPNLHLSSVPASDGENPSDRHLPDRDRSSRFGSPVIISRICARQIKSASMAKEVVDCGSLRCGYTHNFQPRWTDRVTLTTLVNHGVYSETFLSVLSLPSIRMRKSLTRWAGLSSGTGNVLSHLLIPDREKVTVRKRCGRDDGTHDLDTRAHDRRDPRSELATKWPKISPMTSGGILVMAASSASVHIREVGCGWEG